MNVVTVKSGKVYCSLNCKLHELYVSFIANFRKPACMSESLMSGLSQESSFATFHFGFFQSCNRILLRHNFMRIFIILKNFETMLLYAYKFRRFFSANSIDDSLICAKIIQERILQKRRPYIVTNRDIETTFGYRRAIATSYRRTLRNPTIRNGILHHLKLLHMKEDGTIISPTGMELEHSFLDWCGGVFDGDGFVSFNNRSRTSYMSINQNGTYLDIFHSRLGGSYLRRANGVAEWKAHGLLSYLIAHMLRDHCHKKQAELDKIISLHEGVINYSEYVSDIRHIKDSYYSARFDVEHWSKATIAGWIILMVQFH